MERARSELADRVAKLSTESESITAQLEEAELRASAAIKSAATMETQLSEAQAQLEEETRQKLALNSRLRQVEGEKEALREQLEEEEENKKNLEKQVKYYIVINLYYGLSFVTKHHLELRSSTFPLLYLWTFVNLPKKTSSLTLSL